MTLRIDWDDLPLCSEAPELVVSPYICIEDNPPHLPPQESTPIPIPTSLGLVIVGLALLNWFRRKS